MWFVFALATMLFWGAADLFYKKGADAAEPYSHLKTAAAVGIVMGLHAAGQLLFGDTAYDFSNILRYLPVSILYILSMTVGYFGLRYLELSVSSPVQNASGAVTCILLLVFLKETLAPFAAVSVALVSIGVIGLGVAEKREISRDEKKYRIGFAAFFIPILYCIIDAFGTFMDGIYLDDIATTPLRGVTEENFEAVANISYELTFLIAAIGILFYLTVIKKERLSLKAQKDRAAAALLETAGQFFYVYAMRGGAVAAAPMIGAYCAVSVVFSRLFLREKLTGGQYAAIAAVILGVVGLAFYE